MSPARICRHCATSLPDCYRDALCAQYAIRECTEAHNPRTKSQVSLNRIVAVKMILASKFASEAEVKRFRAEAEAVTNLHHPHIVTIHQVGEQDGHHYFSMPFIEGNSLTALVESGRWLLDEGRAAARLLVQFHRNVSNC